MLRGLFITLGGMKIINNPHIEDDRVVIQLDNRLQQVLHAYGIQPQGIEEVTPRLFRVTDYQRAYAIKKSSLTSETVEYWKNVYTTANSQNLASVLPIFLTKNGDFFHQQEGEFYYVSPWIEERYERIDDVWIADFYESPATVHHKTKRSQKIPKEKISKQFLTFQTYCKDARNHLLTFVGQFEKNRYMSPFELLVCTQFRDVEYALNEIDKRINLFLNDDEEDYINWNYALCHLNLNATHVRSPYIINWEKSRFDNPVMDLVQFFNQEIGNYNPSVDRYIDLFSSYTKVNEVHLPELQLFSIYLLSPVNYIQLIYEYIESIRTESMIAFIQQLQQEYRKILFGLSWSDYVEKEFEGLQLDDLDDLDD